MAGMGLLRTFWDMIRPRLGERRTAFGRMSAVAAVTFFLTVILFIIGFILNLMGVDLGVVDLWLEGHGKGIDSVATLAFRLVAGLVLLVCVVLIASGLFGKRGGAGLGSDKSAGGRSGRDRPGRDRPGIGSLVLLAIIGYFAWIGMTGDL